LKIDFHIHSHYSPDSVLAVEDILKIAQERGLDGVAVTDHDTLKGSLKALELNRDEHFVVIPGAEYATEEGHLLALFLYEEINLKKIPRGRNDLLSWKAICDAVHEKGGLIFLAHPFKKKNRPLILPEFLAAIDGLEGYNARAQNGGNLEANELARAKAKELNLPCSAGTDAHWPQEIGAAYWYIEEETKKIDITLIKEKLLKGEGTIFGNSVPPVYESLSQLVKAWRSKNFKRMPRVLAKIALTGTEQLFKR